MSFRRKGSPYYWISYRDHTGRRIRESTKFERKAQADIFERSKRNAIAFARGGLADPDAGKRTTFAELVDWYWDRHGDRLKSTTLKGSIRKHLVPPLGHLPLASISPPLFQETFDRLEDVLAPSSRNHLRAAVRRMFKLASKRGVGLWSGANPIEEVERARTVKRTADFLRLHEVGPLLSALQGQWRWVVATALFTALREGEIFGLLKSDVDWSLMEITLRRSWDSETTKARKDLVIPIARDLAPFLRAAVEASDSPLVFPNRQGRMYSNNININERIATGLKAAGLVIGYDHKCRRCGFKERRTSSSVTKCPTCRFTLWVTPVPRPITVHKLRHTTGTLLAKAGVPIHLIQRVLGHADIRVTREHYLHLDTGDARAAIDGNLVFAGLPRPTDEARGTFQAQSLAGQKDEGRDPPVSRAKPRPSESGRQDLNLRPLGPEAAPDPWRGVARRCAKHAKVITKPLLALLSGPPAPACNPAPREARKAT
jgi:integrase